MNRFPRLEVCMAGLLVVGGCHFRAGLGPAPAAPPSVEHSQIRDTIEACDGSKTTNETDKTTTTFEDGRSTTRQTVNKTITRPTVLPLEPQPRRRPTDPPMAPPRHRRRVAPIDASSLSDATQPHAFLLTI